MAVSEDVVEASSSPHHLTVTTPIDHRTPPQSDQFHILGPELPDVIKWSGDSFGETVGEPEAPTSGMTALAADLQDVQRGFVQY